MQDSVLNPWNYFIFFPPKAENWGRKVGKYREKIKVIVGMGGCLPHEDGPVSPCFCSWLHLCEPGTNGLSAGVWVNEQKKVGMKEQSNKWMIEHKTKLTGPTTHATHSQHFYLLWNQETGNIQDSFEGHPLPPSHPATQEGISLFLCRFRRFRAPLPQSWVSTHLCSHPARFIGFVLLKSGHWSIWGAFETLVCGV